MESKIKVNKCVQCNTCATSFKFSPVVVLFLIVIDYKCLNQVANLSGCPRAKIFIIVIDYTKL